MPLTDSKIRALQPRDKAYRVTDAAGLYIEVSTTGAKYWRVKYRIDGREKRLAVGVYPEVSLADARAARDRARLQLRDGIDPSAAKKAARRAAGESFEAVAREWLDRERVAGRGRRKRGIETATADGTLSRFVMYVFPKLGKRPLAAITTADLLDDVLRPLESLGKIETAHRVKWAVSRVYRYAIQTRRAEVDPTAALRGALAPLQHEARAAITDPRAFAGLLRAIDGYTGAPQVRLGLQLSALLVSRPGELRAMRWAEIDDADEDSALWRIPAERMKMRRDHIVPLPRQALELLRQLRELFGAGLYVLPAVGKPRSPLSENALNGALRRLGFTGDEMTAHGFRASASTMLHELGWDSLVIEAQLSHEDPDKVRGVYNRAAYLQQRREMLQAWADYLDKLRAQGTSGVA